MQAWFISPPPPAGFDSADKFCQGMAERGPRPQRFGQVVIGPAGAGKTTYCAGMQQLLAGIKRPCVVVNLDPANDNMPCASLPMH